MEEAPLNRTLKQEQMVFVCTDVPMLLLEIVILKFSLEVPEIL